MDPGLIAVLGGDSAASAVFKVVVKARKALFKDIVHRAKASPEAAKAALAELQCHLLVERVEGPVDDLDLYFLTSEGLSAARDARRLLAQQE